MVKTKLTLQDNTEIIKQWLSGEYSKSRLAKNWNITVARLMKIVTGEPITNTLIEKQHFAINVEKEQKKIADIKDKVLRFLEDAVEEGNSAMDKMQYVDKIMAIMGQMDKVQRLNNGEATVITKNETQETNVVVNVADIVKDLQTSDDKKNFLTLQMDKIKFGD